MKKLCFIIFLIITLFALVMPAGCSKQQSQAVEEVERLIQEGSFDRASELIDTLSDQVDGDTLSDLKSRLDTAVSAESFKKGSLLFERCEFEEALQFFENVGPGDENYSEAEKKISEIKELLFESYINESREYYNEGKTDQAVEALERALKIRDSKPVRELLEYYMSNPEPGEDRLSVEELQEAIKQMQSYEKGTGQLKISLDNIYSKEIQLGNNPIKTSGDTVFLKLWVNIINEGDSYCLIKPEYIKLVTRNNREYVYHQDYTKTLDIPFREVQLPPKGRASGRLVFVLPLEKSYRFEYNDGDNIINKTVIPY